MKFKSSTSRLQISPALTAGLRVLNDRRRAKDSSYLYKDRVETQRGIPADTSKV